MKFFLPRRQSAKLKPEIWTLIEMRKARETMNTKRATMCKVSTFQSGLKYLTAKPPPVATLTILTNANTMNTKDATSGMRMVTLKNCCTVYQPPSFMILK